MNDEPQWYDPDWLMEYEHNWDDDLTEETDELCTGIDRDQPESGYREYMGNTDTNDGQDIDTKEISIYTKSKSKLIQTLIKQLDEIEIEYTLDYSTQLLSFEKYMDSKEDQQYVYGVVSSYFCYIFEDILYNDFNILMDVDVDLCLSNSIHPIHLFFFPNTDGVKLPVVLCEFNQKSFTYLDLECLCALFKDTHAWWINNKQLH